MSFGHQRILCGLTMLEHCNKLSKFTFVVLGTCIYKFSMLLIIGLQCFFFQSICFAIFIISGIYPSHYLLFPNATVLLK